MMHVSVYLKKDGLMDKNLITVVNSSGHDTPSRHEQYYWRWHWHWLFGGIDIDNWHWIGDFWIIDIDIDIETGQLSFAIIDIEIDIEVKGTIDIDIEWSFKTIDSSIKSQ